MLYLLVFIKKQEIATQQQQNIHTEKMAATWRQSIKNV